MREKFLLICKLQAVIILISLIGGLFLEFLIPLGGKYSFPDWTIFSIFFVFPILEVVCLPYFIGNTAGLRFLFTFCIITCTYLYALREGYFLATLIAPLILAIGGVILSIIVNLNPDGTSNDS